MNTTELIGTIAKETGLEKSLVEKVTNGVFETISRRLLKGEKTLIRGFGTFSTVKENARKGRNPQTGEEVKIPKRTSPKFSFSEALSDQVRGKRKKTSAKTTAISKQLSNKKWLYAKDGKPSQKYYTIAGLKRLGISKETMVWSDGMSEWKSAGKVRELKELFATPKTAKSVKAKPKGKTTPPPIPA